MKNIELLDSLSLKQFKAVFFDIDGTIVNRHHKISIPTRDAIAQLRKYDITVSLATGRPYFGASAIANDLGVKSPSLFCAGALIVEPDTGTTLFSQAIEPEVLETLIQAVSQTGLYCELYTLTDYYINQTHPFAAIHAQYLQRIPKIISFTELITTQEIIKVGFTVERKSVQETMLYETLARFDMLQFATAAGASHPHLLWGSATHKNATREKGFELLTLLLNISPENIIAFGDGESDIPFLKLAGVGIAMGNSPQSVQDAARVVTKSVDEEGVFYAISQLGASQK